MKIEEFKAMFKGVLQDEDIKDEIKIICSNKNKVIENEVLYAKELENKILELQNVVEKIDEDKNCLNMKLKLKEDTIIGLNNELKIKENNINNLKIDILNKEEQIESLNNTFKSLKEIYNMYLNISDNTKESIKGIFKGDDIESFIFCGIQYENIELLWDFIRLQIIEGQLEDIYFLKKLFDYFFVSHNKIYESMLYKRQEVFVGDEFDDDKHIKSSSSKASGNISEILFYGYINCKTKKIIKKTVVKI